jgi:hypothetical protein
MKQAYDSKAVNNADFNFAAQNESYRIEIDKDRESHVAFNRLRDGGFQFCSYP